MFNVITPEKAGISSKNILKFVKTLDKYNLSTHSIIMARGNNIFLEAYYAPFQKDYQHRMYSISKSFVSIAIGLVIEEGLVSIDDKMIKYFQEYLSNDTHKLLKEMTIKDMLTMQTCVVNHKKWFYLGLEDRIKAYFQAEIGKKPGTSWNYDSPASFMLSCIVEKVTGKPFLEYLKDKFLLKAGFSKESYCLKCPGGHSFGDSGIICTARDLLVFARFLMDGGRVDGKKYMNESYIKDATSMQVSNSHGGDYFKGCYGYGYQIWKTMNDGFAFIGMGDQIVICDPKKDFVFIINSDNQGLGDHSRTIIYHELYKEIINNLNEPQEDDLSLFNELRSYLNNLKLFTLKDNIESPVINKVSGLTYKLEDNPMNIEWIRLDFTNKKGVLTYKNLQGEKKLYFGLGYNEFSQFPHTGYSKNIAGIPEKDNKYYCAASADLPMNNKLRIKVQIIDIYFGNLNIEISFKDDEIGVCMIKNAEAFLDEYEGYAIGKVINY